MSLVSFEALAVATAMPTVAQALDGVVLHALAFGGTMAAVCASTEVFIPLLLTRRHGVPPLMVGFGVTGGAVSWSIGSWWQSWPSLAWSRLRVIQTGTISLVVGLAIIMPLTAPAVPPIAAMAGWPACGLGMGLIIPSLSAQTLDLSPSHAPGSNSSALQLSDTTFMAVGVTITGSLFAALLSVDATTGYLVCFSVAVTLAALAAGIAHRIGTPEAVA